MSFFNQFHVGPNPNPAEVTTEQVNEVRTLIEEFVEETRNQARQRGVEGVRLLRPLFLFIDVDGEHIHLVFTNEAAHGTRTCTFYWHPSSAAPHSLLDAVKVAVTEAGYPSDGIGFVSLPQPLLTISTEERREEIMSIANVYVDEDLRHMEVQRRTVQINPTFAGRGFIVDPTLCFVLMPFADESRPIYDDHIVPAIQQAGLRALRADDIFNNRQIIEDIWEHINRARVVVADLTGRNPNVYYEVGISHTVGKDVILLTQAIDDVPFDLRHIRVITYEYTPRGCADLEQSLTTTLRNVTQGHEIGPQG